MKISKELGHLLVDRLIDANPNEDTDLDGAEMYVNIPEGGSERFVVVIARRNGAVILSKIMDEFAARIKQKWQIQPPGSEGVN